jgi:hypothetical protein
MGDHWYLGAPPVYLRTTMTYEVYIYDPELKKYYYGFPFASEQVARQFTNDWVTVCDIGRGYLSPNKWPKANDLR